MIAAAECYSTDELAGSLTRADHLTWDCGNDWADPYGHDRDWRHKIFRKYPASFGEKLAEDYRATYQSQGRRVANVRLLEIDGRARKSRLYALEPVLSGMSCPRSRHSCVLEFVNQRASDQLMFETTSCNSSDDVMLNVPFGLVWTYLTHAQKDRLWSQTEPRYMPPWSQRAWREFSRDEQFVVAQAFYRYAPPR